MIGEPFEGPFLKIDRARQHLKELTVASTAFADRVVVSFGEYDPVARTRKVKFSEPTPMLIACIVGDVAHNLRSALDLAVCDVATLRGKPITNLDFPIAASAAHLDRKIQKSRLDTVDPLIASFARSIHKFTDFNRMLCDLHELDRRDKHRLITPTLVKSYAIIDPVQYQNAAMRATMLHYGYTDPQPEGAAEELRRAAPNSLFMEKDGALEMMMTMGDEPYPIEIQDGTDQDMASERDPSEFLALIDGVTILRFPSGDAPFAGDSVIETLEYLVEAISEMLNEFRRMFDPRYTS